MAKDITAATYTGNRVYEALGESAAFMDFHERLSRVSRVERPVLIVGERGTGKELAVSRLHYLSRRWQGPLVALNCAALAPGVLESELFGHEAGAYTGAGKRRMGRFEAAEGGSLFLDEIGLIPVTVQEKILRVVEYGSFERVGGSEPVSVDVRIIGATNADLPAMARAGKFKEDLLDRLSFEVLNLPPLRARLEDLELLVRHFSARMAAELELPTVPEFSEPALRALRSYDWPGNIRELKNVVERAVYASNGKRIEQVNFDPFASPYGVAGRQTAAAQADASATAAHSPLQTGCGVPGSGCSLVAAVREFELQALREALRQAQHHQGRAAELLGLGYHQFRSLYRKHRAALQDS